ncbi:hypothetical protein [Elizabethkingia phage TCUEAP1]|nr:hypothetical protein [Elizabethkingia phage TCUEAP1]
MKISIAVELDTNVQAEHETMLGMFGVLSGNKSVSTIVAQQTADNTAAVIDEIFADEQKPEPKKRASRAAKPKEEVKVEAPVVIHEAKIAEAKSIPETEVPAEAKIEEVVEVVPEVEAVVEAAQATEVDPFAVAEPKKNISLEDFRPILMAAVGPDVPEKKKKENTDACQMFCKTKFPNKLVKDYTPEELTIYAEFLKTLV